MNKKPDTTDVIKRLLPPLAVWAVGKVLEVPRVQRVVKKVDRKAMRKMHRGASNAGNHRAWFAAGAAAFVLGIGLMAKSVKK
jgi:hypothetical protein